MKKIAIIAAQVHDDVVTVGVTQCVTTLKKLGNYQVDQFSVPGGFELPLKSQQLADKYDAIVAAAFIVDGGIYRHEFVAQTAIQGLMDVQLKTGTPIFSLALTPQKQIKTAADTEFFLEHMKTKGIEVATACHEILSQ